MPIVPSTEQMPLQFSNQLLGVQYQRLLQFVHNGINKVILMKNGLGLNEKPSQQLELSCLNHTEKQLAYFKLILKFS